MEVAEVEAGAIAFEPVGDERWRWIYRDDRIELASNDTYPNFDAAVTAAATAYPDADLGLPTSSETPERRGLDGLSWPVALLLILLALFVFKR